MAQKIISYSKRVLFFIFLILHISCMKEEDDTKRTPENSFLLLQEGNKRFMSGKLIHPNRSDESRAKTIEEQKPFAVVLSCSDSRASPEIIFDQGIGDLFVIRVAGNVAGNLEEESILFAVDELEAPLVVILGHQRCGAIKAVLEGNIEDIPDISKKIAPALFGLSKETKDEWREAIEANVSYICSELTNKPIFKKFIEKNQLMIVGGYYNFETGEVEWLQKKQ